MVQSVTGDPLVGRSLGPYLLEDRLGAGGMGTVYRAVHRELCQTRAIKVLQTGSANDPSFLERFRREARLAAGLRHPNIVTIYDFGEQDGEYYVAMEYLAGRPLNDVLRSSGPLPPDRAIGMLEQLADALDYAHAQGLVHRDVKPANVMVEPNGHLTLLDFGISRAVDGTRMTRTGLIMGTIAYMAPELLTTGVDGPSVDQYALGVVAYEMLTGRVPFEGTNTPAVIYAQAHTPPPPPRTFRAGLPLALEGSILRQLSKYPDERYPSGRAFVAALRAAVWPTPAPPPSLVAPEPPPTTRRQDPGRHPSPPAGAQPTAVRPTGSTVRPPADRRSTMATRSETANTIPGPVGRSAPRDRPAATRALPDAPTFSSLWRQMAVAGLGVGAGVITVGHVLAIMITTSGMHLYSAGSPFVGGIEPSLEFPQAFLLVFGLPAIPTLWLMTRRLLIPLAHTSLTPRAGLWATAGLMSAPGAIAVFVLSMVILQLMRPELLSLDIHDWRGGYVWAFLASLHAIVALILITIFVGMVITAIAAQRTSSTAHGATTHGG